MCRLHGAGSNGATAEAHPARGHRDEFVPGARGPVEASSVGQRRCPPAPGLGFQWAVLTACIEGSCRHRDWSPRKWGRTNAAFQTEEPHDHHTLDPRSTERSRLRPGLGSGGRLRVHLQLYMHMHLQLHSDRRLLLHLYLYLYLHRFQLVPGVPTRRARHLEGTAPESAPCR